MNKILGLKKQFNDKNEQDKFIKKTIDMNINKMHYPQIILILLNLILIIIDIFVYKCFNSDNKAYMSLFISHITVIGSGVVWIFFYYKLKHKLSSKINGIIFLVFCNIILYWCAFMNVALFTTNRQVSAYIIGTFIIAALFYILPIITLVMQLLLYTVTIIGLAIVSNFDIGIYNIINLTFTLVFSNIVSITIFNHYRRDYLNKEKLIISKNELEILYNERTEFLANVSHELRTPLNMLYAAQKMVSLTTDNDNYKNEKFDKYMDLMKQNTNRLTRLINNLLDITKIEASSFIINKKNTNIIKLVEDIVLSSVDYVENKGISITFDTDIEEVIIGCDASSIERIILNLLSNAVKFTDKGGSIFVNIKSDESYIYISVKDNGIGISSHMQKSIFKRFVQADKSISRNNEGTGIGLALVESMVKLHNGNIEVHSKIGRGSTFIVTLPITTIQYQDKVKNRIIKGKNVERVEIEFSDIYN